MFVNSYNFILYTSVQQEINSPLAPKIVLVPIGNKRMPLKNKMKCLKPFLISVELSVYSVYVELRRTTNDESEKKCDQQI